MTKFLPLLVLFFVLSTAFASHHSHNHNHFLLSSGGTIAETLGEEEFDLGSSEMSRRILADKRYISYGALKRDTTPCSRRGASYYNCRPGAQANPYSRGCSAITRCKS